MDKVMYRMPEYLESDFASLARREGVTVDELIERALVEFFTWHSGPERGQRWLPLTVPQPNTRAWAELSGKVVFKLDQVAKAHQVKPVEITFTAIHRFMEARGEDVDTMSIKTQQAARLKVEPRFVERIEACMAANPEAFPTKVAFYEKAARVWFARRYEQLDTRYHYRRYPRLDDAGAAYLAVTMPNPLGQIVSASAEEDGVNKSVLFYNVLLDFIEANEQGQGVAS